jgi:PPK2 family polyphosphate:nucleotide phosphotransferase
MIFMHAPVQILRRRYDSGSFGDGETAASALSDETTLSTHAGERSMAHGKHAAGDKNAAKRFDPGATLRVPPGKPIALKEWTTSGKSGVPERDEAELATEEFTRHIGDLQDGLYAEGRQSLLVVLQGMDASGKDGTVRKVFSHVNPTGVKVTSFKTPTPVEMAHDFLWRVHAATPGTGQIGVFNRSHYEDVLIVRVHADTMLRIDRRDRKNLWEERFALINSFEELLNQNNTRVLKFFLHISPEEQCARFRSRQEDASKHWKLAAGDFAERKLWPKYMEAYEAMLPATSTAANPWHIIPADHKWVRNYHIARVIADTLAGMNPKAPPIADKSLITRKFK